MIPNIIKAATIIRIQGNATTNLNNTYNNTNGIIIHLAYHRNVNEQTTTITNK